MAWSVNKNRKKWSELKPSQRLEFRILPGCSLIEWNPQYKEWLATDRCGRWWPDRIYRLVPVVFPKDDPTRPKEK